jgi:serine/threonine protein phosphatase PrpC
LLESLGSSEECFIYASVFDGHLGSAAASFASNFVFDEFKGLLRTSDPATVNLDNFLLSSLKKADDAFLRNAEERGLKDGSTATVAILHNHTITIANIGDSRGILVRTVQDDGTDPDAASPSAAGEAAAAGAVAHEAVPLTVDHRPDLPAERQRIEAAGGRVEHTRGAWRVQGDLAISRAIGNAPLRPLVVADPDFRTVPVRHLSRLLAA